MFLNETKALLFCLEYCLFSNEMLSLVSTILLFIVSACAKIFSSIFVLNIESKNDKDVLRAFLSLLL